MPNLQREIQYLKGVGEKRAKQFNKLGIFTIDDLLCFYPRKYIDFSAPYPIASAPYNTDCVVKATIYSINAPTRVKGGKAVQKIMAGDESGGLVITYFNNPYAAKNYTVDREYLIFGKINGSFTRREVINPLPVPINIENKLMPVYHLTQGIGSKYISNCVKTAIELCKDEIEETLPPDWLQRYRLPSLSTAIQQIHMPNDEKHMQAARRRLIFDELISMQLGMLMLRGKSHKQSGAKILKADLDVFFNALPFTPTGAQLKAIDEIVADFKGDAPMNRLLQGDVGSGKTLVAAAGMVCAAQNGFQSVLMAPTEILAAQHAATLSKLLEPMGMTVALLTAGVKTAAKKTLLKAIESGTADVVVGTHAVIGDKVNFKNLGFAVTDEQHRFGVRQRSMLAKKADNPHLLVMSATPIPRTLALLMFGDLDISILDELPKGRTPIKTYIVGSEKRSAMFGFIDKQIQQGRQAYIVCPLIEESENEAAADMQSVKDYYENVAKKLLPHRKIGLMHGRLKAAEKNEIMQSFKNGDIDILCSTTVIEVGVDVPNSTVMVIENAERYGLSALHQLRGRVGRGTGKSYCILVSDNSKQETVERLSYLCSHTSGFDVAKYDLEHRGPGDFFGSRQHGLPMLKIADLMADERILYSAQQIAKQVIEQDPTLSKNEHKGLLKMTKKLFEKTEGALN